MTAESRQPAVFEPTTMGELVELRHRMPKATIWAGGTGLMSRYYPYPYPVSREIIHLKHVADLSRISRTERYLEIGAMATFEHVLKTGRHILPPVLARAIATAGPPIISSQATMGGNLCIPDLRLNLASGLSLFSVLVELRGGRSQSIQGRWIPFNKLYQKEGGLQIKETEILTRIRISFDEGDFQFFQHIGFPYRYPNDSVLFAVFARHGDSSVSDYRVSITIPRVGIFRDRDVESAVSNCSLPLTASEIRLASGQLRESLQNYSDRITPIQYARSVRAFERSLSLLNTKVLGR